MVDSFTLQAQYSVDLARDLSNVDGINVEAELTRILQAEIEAEFKRKRLNVEDYNVVRELDTESNTMKLVAIKKEVAQNG